MKTKNKISIKLIIGIVLVVVGIIPIIVGLVVSGKNDNIDPYDARDGVVMVYSEVADSSGNSAWGWGTGWAIGVPGEPVQYIVTNGHVVEMAYVYPKYDPETYMGAIRVYYNAAENDYVTPEVVFYSGPEEKDICILRLPTPTEKRSALLIRDSAEVSIGDEVYALGYPGKSNENQQYTTFGMDDITLTKGIISKRTKPVSFGYNAFQMDVFISSGNSGGPLVDVNGHVVGINSAGLQDSTTGLDAGVNYAILSEELMRILDDERITYTMAGENSNKGLAVVCIILGFLVVAGGAVLIILACVVKEPASKSQTKAAKGGRAVLTGVTGRYAGQSFELLKGKLVIGRDPSVCNIVYDKSTPGISAMHCQVVYDSASDSFILTDMGSSHGTFLGNGKKLTASTPETLSSGDTFYLCDVSNKFAVKKE